MTGDEAVVFLLEVLDEHASCSFAWTDPDGAEHTTDIGYAYGFLRDIKEYADGVGGLDAMRERYKEKGPGLV